VDPARQSSHRQTSANNAVPTAGEILRDGTIVELVRVQEQSRLLVWRNRQSRIVARYESSGTVFEAVSLDSTTLAAIRFPTGSARYGSVAKLFARILDALSRLSGLPRRELQLVPYWILASWFPELLPLLPTLNVLGPSAADARRFLRILRCFCRRGALVTSITPSSLLNLPMQLRATLLVHQGKFARSVEDLLEASSLCGSYIPRAGGFLDLRTSTAIYCEENDLNGDIRQRNLSVSLFPVASAVPVFDLREEEQLAAEFQPQLLRYRLERFEAVRNSTFDAPRFTTEVRDLVRSLAACVTGEPVLTTNLTSLLASEDEDARSKWSSLPEFAIVTALLALVHERRESRVPVTNLTRFVNVALRASGEIKEYNPVEIGRVLSRLDIPRSRSAGGMVIPLTRDLSRRVHYLGGRYGVTISSDAYPGCPDCSPSDSSGARQLVQGVQEV
jgi:hypothetical protein